MRAFSSSFYGTRAYHTCMADIREVTRQYNGSDIDRIKEREVGEWNLESRSPASGSFRGPRFVLWAREPPQVGSSPTD